MSSIWIAPLAAAGAGAAVAAAVAAAVRREISELQRSLRPLRVRRSAGRRPPRI
ncbi:MAG: hypothetical protein M0Z30_24500 [Actinomycetota bacterium]|nr:hypothetical protein [Actinomycetota bacterium]